jgi:hypothetical protein
MRCLGTKHRIKGSLTIAVHSHSQAVFVKYTSHCQSIYRFAAVHSQSRQSRMYENYTQLILVICSQGETLAFGPLL